MQFLKKNYEKILLGLVLAGLVGILISMFFFISADEEALRNKTTTATMFHGAALPDLNLSAQNNATNRMRQPYILDFDSENKVFNPMEWKRDLNNNLIPVATQVGLKVVQVTNITPLYLIIKLEEAKTNEFGARYVISVERQAEKSPMQRRARSHWVSVGDKNDAFSLVSVKGPPEKPDGLVLKLTGTGDLVTISGTQSYQRVEGYAADFVYPPEKRVFHDERTGDTISFNGTQYVVADVTAHELILMDESNQKKTSLRFTP